MSETEAMERNLRAFDKKLPNLLEEHLGQYVIFADEQMVQVFDSYPEAVSYGYKHYPDEHDHYLLQKVEPITDRLNFHLSAECRAS